jgi:hypothetical protein
MVLWLTTLINDPNEKLGLQTTFKKLIMENVDNQILTNSCFSKIKSLYLEVLICTHRGDFEIKKCSKTDRGKYFTFQFWLPYPLIMAADNYLVAFIDYVFDGLKQVVAPYNLPIEILENCRKDVKEELLAHQNQYKYVRPAFEDIIDKALEELDKKMAAKALAK